jgi:Bacterial regulatory proteins, luxR family
MLEKGPPDTKIVSLPQRHASEQELVSRLDPRERQILELLLKGYKHKHIAAELDITEAAISRITQRPAFQAAWNCWRPATDQELDYQADRAVERALNSQDEIVGLRAAETRYKLRGRGGFGRSDDPDAGDKVSAEDLAQAIYAIAGGSMPPDGLSAQAVAIAKDMAATKDLYRAEDELKAREQALAAKEQAVAAKEQELQKREQAVRTGEHVVRGRGNGHVCDYAEAAPSGMVPDWA